MSANMPVPTTAAVDEEPKKDPVPLVVTLARMLEAENISHCLWKGTYSFDGVLSGEKDVDLLVSRTDYGAFIAILGRLGFKEAYAPGHRPSVVHHFYGHDPKSDRLVHIHSASIVLLGNSTTGVYRLPLEDLFLSSAAPGRLFRVLPPELEASAFVLRMVLWQSPTRVLVPFGRGPYLPKRRSNELTHLLDRAEPERVRRLVDEYLPSWDASTFDACVRMLRGEGDSVENRRCWTLARRAVRPWPQRSRGGQLLSVLWRRTTRALARSFRPSSPRRRLIGGGAVIAFIGGDGAGKSTVIRAVVDWLGKELDVQRLHFGKPSWSWTTRLVRGLVGVARRMSVMLGRPGFEYDKGQREARRYSVMLRHVCTARDRYRHYLRALRAARRGTIVICDRFPTARPVSVDGPLLSDILGGEQDGNSVGWLARFLAHLEGRYYTRIGEPDLRIVLRLHPDLAAERKAEEGVRWVRSRNREIWEADWSGSRASVVDASAPAADVRGIVRDRVWAQL